MIFHAVVPRPLASHPYVQDGARRVFAGRRGWVGGRWVVLIFHCPCSSPIVVWAKTKGTNQEIPKVWIYEQAGHLLISCVFPGKRGDEQTTLKTHDNGFEPSRPTDLRD